MYKRMIAMALVIVMVFSVTALATEGTKMAGDLTEMEQMMLAQLPAVGAYEELRTTFTLINDEIVAYPDGYGGSFINDENELEIKIVQGYSSYQIQLESLLADYPVCFASCVYSMNELIEYQEDVIEYSEYLSSSYISQKDGKVRLFAMSDNVDFLETELAYPITRGILESPYEINAVEDEERDTVEWMQDGRQAKANAGLNATNRTIEIYGGDTLGYYKYPYSSSLYTHSTVCITGSFRNGRTVMDNCILTAGHVALTSEDLYISTSDSESLGFVYSNYEDYCSGDIGVLSYNEMEYCNSTTVWTSDTSVANLDFYYGRTDVVEGLPVVKYGATTGLTSGKVRGQYGYDYGNPITICDVIPVEPVGDTMNQDGDSGGPVWTVDRDGDWVLLGIVSGWKKIDTGNRKVMFYTPIQAAVDEGFEPYYLDAITRIYWDEQE